MCHRNLIQRKFSRRKVRRRVHMRAVVFQHPETASQVTIFFRGGDNLRFERFLVAGPSRQFTVDRIRHVYNTG